MVIWAAGGLLRFGWLLSWAVALKRTRWPRSIVLGVKKVMQTDFPAVMGILSAAPRDRSGRPRFCGHGSGHQGCIDPDRPLADRVYHCSHFRQKCEEDARRPLDIVHLPVYDHYCSWLGVCVYLDTIKPYLLLMVFLLFDAIIVFSCSIVAVTLPDTWEKVVHAPVVALATTIVLWLCGHNVYFKTWHLALRNITIPEMGMLHTSRGGSIMFAIRLDQTDELIFGRFRGNPWDLGRRNLHQVFGGWDCLLPFRQPPRCVGYGRSGRSDFEMTEEFWRWVEEQEREHRSRAAGSRPAVAPLDQRAEVHPTSSRLPLEVVDAPPPAPLRTPPPPPHSTSPATPMVVPPEEIPLPDSPTP